MGNICAADYQGENDLIRSPTYEAASRTFPEVPPPAMGKIPSGGESASSQQQQQQQQQRRGRHPMSSILLFPAASSSSGDSRATTRSAAQAVLDAMVPSCCLTNQSGKTTSRSEGGGGGLLCCVRRSRRPNGDNEEGDSSDDDDLADDEIAAVSERQQEGKELFAKSQFVAAILASREALLRRSKYLGLLDHDAKSRHELHPSCTFFTGGDGRGGSGASFSNSPQSTTGGTKSPSNALTPTTALHGNRASVMDPLGESMKRSRSLMLLHGAMDRQLRRRQSSLLRTTVPTSSVAVDEMETSGKLDVLAESSLIHADLGSVIDATLLRNRKAPPILGSSQSAAGSAALPKPLSMIDLSQQRKVSSDSGVNLNSANSKRSTTPTTSLPSPIGALNFNNPHHGANSGAAVAAAWKESKCIDGVVMRLIAAHHMRPFFHSHVTLLNELGNMHLAHGTLGHAWLHFTEAAAICRWQLELALSIQTKDAALADYVDASIGLVLCYLALVDPGLVTKQERVQLQKQAKREAERKEEELHKTNERFSPGVKDSTANEPHEDAAPSHPRPKTIFQKVAKSISKFVKERIADEPETDPSLSPSHSALVPPVKPQNNALIKSGSAGVAANSGGTAPLTDVQALPRMLDDLRGMALPFRHMMPTAEQRVAQWDNGHCRVLIEHRDVHHTVASSSCNPAPAATNAAAATAAVREFSIYLCGDPTLGPLPAADASVLSGSTASHNTATLSPDSPPRLTLSQERYKALAACSSDALGLWNFPVYRDLVIAFARHMSQQPASVDALQAAEHQLKETISVVHRLDTCRSVCLIPLLQLECHVSLLRGNTRHALHQVQKSLGLTYWYRCNAVDAYTLAVHSISLVEKLKAMIQRGKAAMLLQRWWWRRLNRSKANTYHQTRKQLRRNEKDADALLLQIASSAVFQQAWSSPSRPTRATSFTSPLDMMQVDADLGDSLRRPQSPAEDAVVGFGDSFSKPPPGSMSTTQEDKYRVAAPMSLAEATDVVSFSPTVSAPPQIPTTVGHHPATLSPSTTLEAPWVRLQLEPSTVSMPTVATTGGAPVFAPPSLYPSSTSTHSLEPTESAATSDGDPPLMAVCKMLVNLQLRCPLILHDRTRNFVPEKVRNEIFRMVQERGLEQSTRDLETQGLVVTSCSQFLTVESPTTGVTRSSSNLSSGRATARGRSLSGNRAPWASNATALDATAAADQLPPTFNVLDRRRSDLTARKQITNSTTVVVASSHVSLANPQLSAPPTTADSTTMRTTTESGVTIDVCNDVQAFTPTTTNLTPPLPPTTSSPSPDAAHTEPSHSGVTNNRTIVAAEAVGQQQPSQDRPVESPEPTSNGSSSSNDSNRQNTKKMHHKKAHATSGGGGGGGGVLMLGKQPPTGTNDSPHAWDVTSESTGPTLQPSAASWDSMPL